ncbi:MAG: hypothetical protein KUG56_02605 [Kordiimonadaceae bacterium]|nr:hypothetical protein [Kordiimonadaceae bacterium]
MFKHIASVFSFMVVTFAVQGGSHFFINKQHFADISFLRPEPIMQLGFTTMIVQGLILSLALSKLAPVMPSFKDGLKVSAAFGVFLGTYIVLTEPAKYAAPSVIDWMLVEGPASFVQFALFGFVLAFVHQRLGPKT